MDNLLLVSGIPTSLQIADVRAFFAGGTAARWFDVFHYRRRRINGGSNCCALVRPSAEVPGTAAAIIRRYHGKPWLTRTGKVVEGTCQIHPLTNESLSIVVAGQVDGTDEFLSNKDRKTLLPGVRVPVRSQGGSIALHVSCLPELLPPPGLPNGNIGTPVEHIKAMIDGCKLPVSLLKLLDISRELAVFRQQKRKYGAVPPPAEGHARRVDVPDARPVQRQRTAQAPPVQDEDGDEDDAEQWDLHASWHPAEATTHTFRTHTTERQEYVFEEPEGVELVWDKGDASGLVMYTDAQRWELERGGFDERTADDHDVEHNLEEAKDRYGAGGVPFSADEAANFRMTTASIPSRKHSAADRDAPPLISRRDKGLQLAMRIMQRHGWHPGAGLGRTFQGQSDAVEAAQREEARAGLGFVRLQQTVGSIYAEVTNPSAKDGLFQLAAKPSKPPIQFVSSVAHTAPTGQH